jgi:hypothetical protein
MFATLHANSKWLPFLIGIHFKVKWYGPNGGIYEGKCVCNRDWPKKELTCGMS